MNNQATVWGVPFSALTLDHTVDAVTALVEARTPSFAITANTNYAMLTEPQAVAAALTELPA